MGCRGGEGSLVAGIRYLPLWWPLVCTPCFYCLRYYLTKITLSMSDPGTTYRTREEVQRMRSTQDPIRGLQRYIEEWGLATEQDLKVHSVINLYELILTCNHRLWTRLPRQRSTPQSRKLRHRPNLRPRTSGPTSTTRAPNHHS